MKLIVAVALALALLCSTAHASVITGAGHLSCETYNKKEAGAGKTNAIVVCWVEYEDSCTYDVQAFTLLKRSGERGCFTSVVADLCEDTVIEGVDGCGMFTGRDL